MPRNMNSSSLPTNCLPAVYLPQPYYERDSAIIRSAWWAAGLIDLAQSCALPEHKMLRHTGIFHEDIIQQHSICPEQLLQLIHNILKYSGQNDLSFLFGHQLLPGNIPHLSHKLNAANNLGELIDCLVQDQMLFSPLLNLRLCYEGDDLVIYWQDACGADDCFVFLLEALCTAISSFSRWLNGERHPWKFYFAHKAPGYIEQYEVHLQGEVHFECQRNAMAIQRDYCFQPWQKKSNYRSPSTADANECYFHLSQQPQPEGKKGFLTEVYNYLHHNISHTPNLEKTAADFGMSSASFKRKLKKHRSHFQAIYDQVRKDLAVFWINQEGWSSEQVAKKLHFHDVANLRRAFKKWTGMTLWAARN